MKDDPEVIADLQLRARTEFDRSRTKGADVYDWREPATVAAWCCRTRTCRTPVRVTQDAVDNLAMMNRQAKARGYERIRDDEVMYCATCEAAMRVERGVVSQRRSEVMRKHIVELKGGPGADRERDLLKQLEALGHPDVKGFEQAMREKKDSKKTRMRGSL